MDRDTHPRLLGPLVSFLVFVSVVITPSLSLPFVQRVEPAVTSVQRRLAKFDSSSLHQPTNTSTGFPILDPSENSTHNTTLGQTNLQTGLYPSHAQISQDGVNLISDGAANKSMSKGTVQESSSVKSTLPTFQVRENVLRTKLVTKHDQLKPVLNLRTSPIISSEPSAKNVVTQNFSSQDSSDHLPGKPAGHEIFYSIITQPGVQSEALEQKILDTDSHADVPKMVLTLVSAVTALFGVCVMAAIFQCCCRRKRRTVIHSEDSYKPKNEQVTPDRQSRSKSPSPQKVPLIEDSEDKGPTEQDKLIEEDEDLGDFSQVKRETEILRSYRKPPPPKNRARASRVPRALREPDSKEISVLKSLIENDIKETAIKETVEQGVGSSPISSPSRARSQDSGLNNTFSSNLLDDIDLTIAALHEKDKGNQRETTPSRDTNKSRETSVEKTLIPSAAAGLKAQSPHKEAGSSLGKKELSRSLASELPRAVSKEELLRTEKKNSTPSGSANTSPKLKIKDSSALSCKENVSVDSDSRQGSKSSEFSHVKSTEKQVSMNVFALIDPTVNKDEEGDKAKSKIPVRSASSPTALRHGKEFKRFPVPSVHGEQLDQLLKSLKSRLKEDSSTARKLDDKASNEDDLDNAEPQGRDRSYSDPSKQQEGKAESKSEQTHL